MRVAVRTGYCVCSIIALCLAAGAAEQDGAPLVPLPRAAQAFVETHCYDCHDDLSEEGGLDLAKTSFDLQDETAFARWVHIYDRVREGEMPPKRKPDGKAVEAFLGALAKPMMAADGARSAARGRAVLRRLNRYEYENTLRDLFYAPWLQLKDMLPEDGVAHRFNKVGSSLDVSHVQMARYIDAAESAMRQVLAADQVASTTVRYYVREQATFIKRMTYSPFNRSPERTTTPLLGHEAQPDVFEEKAPVTVGDTDPALREQEAFGVVNGNYVGNRYHFDRFEAPAGGRYRLRFKAYSYWAGPGEGDKWWKPDRASASKGRRPEPVTVYSFTPPSVMRRLGSFDAAPEPGVHTLEVHLSAGESIRPDAARLFRSRPGWRGNPLATKQGMPGVAYSWMEVEGPIPPEAPAAARQLLFGELPVGVDGAGRLEVTAKDAREDAGRLLGNFMERAYRRAPEDGEVKRFLAVIHGLLDGGAGFADAMLAGYSAVLCSPGFLYLEEGPGKLPDDALASRLSYFLWNAPPDGELRALARAGRLHRRKVLDQQAQRLLEDPKCGQFVDAFLDYWLDLRKIGLNSPDSILYPDYYLDDLLFESAELETRLFFTELLRGDLPARNLVSSNFAMLNERLALHYGVPDVEGVALRRVALPPGSPRGGLLTQASVLRITANGTTTSPVLRGVWVLERILGQASPPPPAGVPAIDPDTRGATTIREQLELHRTGPECAKCHAKIDPVGLALENFDVLGAWRDQYRGVDEAVEPVKGIGKNGHHFEFHLAQPVDSSGQLPDGRPFEDVTEMKRLLLADERQLARNLARQLVVFATGAPVRFGDRPALEKILDNASATDYGVRTLIREIVQSNLFRSK